MEPTKTRKQQYICKNCNKRFIDFYSYKAYKKNILKNNSINKGRFGNWKYCKDIKNFNNNFT